MFLSSTRCRHGLYRCSPGRLQSLSWAREEKAVENLYRQVWLTLTLTLAVTLIMTLTLNLILTLTLTITLNTVFFVRPFSSQPSLTPTLSHPNLLGPSGFLKINTHTAPNIHTNLSSNNMNTSNKNLNFNRDLSYNTSGNMSLHPRDLIKSNEGSFRDSLARENSHIDGGDTPPGEAGRSPYRTPR